MGRLMLNRYIDHAVLAPGLSRAQAVEGIQSGIDWKVRTVCVRPSDLEVAIAMCQGSETEVSTVLSFPHGCGLPAVKRAEAEAYVALGAAEIDMVVNYGLIHSAAWDEVAADIRAVSQVTKPAGVLLKVILETSELDGPQIQRATEIAIEAAADFVKTSTGFASGGATREAVALMVETAAERIGVKASGGIRDRATAEAYIAMGCTRLGIGASTVPALLGNQATSQREAY